MDDRILATAWLCLAQARHDPDPTGFALLFTKRLVQKGWPERAARRVYFCVTDKLYGRPFKRRTRAVHRVRFLLAR